jgi:ankyrin repeat protein
MKTIYKVGLSIIILMAVILSLYLPICRCVGNSISDAKFKQYFNDDNYVMMYFYLKAHPEYIIYPVSTGNRTLLHAAVLKNKEKIVKLLVSEGAYINVLDDKHMTPLLYAIKNKKYKIIDSLANTNTMNFYNDGFTPLYYALSKNDYDMVKYLIDKGADVKVKDTYGDNCLQHYLSFIENFVGYPKYEIIYRKHNSKIFDLLIESGADINNINKLKQSVLMTAIHQINSEAVNQLLTSNVDIFYKDPSGETALYYAIFYVNTYDEIDNKKDERENIVRILKNAIKKKKSS